MLLGFGAMILAGCANNSWMQQQNSAANTQQLQPAEPKMVGTNKDGTMSELNLDNQGSEITTSPSKKITVTANYSYDCAQCNQASGNQILVGLAGRSAQACIYDGANKGQGSASFELKTPAVPGTYTVRFRTAQAANCQEALQSWWGMNGVPAQNATIGTITVVKLKS